MKKSEIEVKGLYTARISNRIVRVRVDNIREVTTFRRNRYSGGMATKESLAYDVTNLDTGRKLIFTSAARFRARAATDEQIAERQKRRSEHLEALRNVRELFATY